MTTGMTLFGGLAVVVALFVAARALKLSAEIAGLIAAGIPLVAYMLMLFGHWPGLDVVAIHIAVFVVSAFVLVIFSRYRKQQTRLHWVPKALIAFFLVLVVVNAGLLYVSTNGLPVGIASLLLPGKGKEILHTGFSGTTRHGQDAAKAVSADLSRQHRNDALGWQVRVEGLRQPAVGGNELYIHIEDRDGRPLPGLAGHMRVSRFGAKAVATPIVAASPGEYEARIAFDHPGMWVVELELGDHKQAWRQSWEIAVPVPTR
jgi:hypothetical protein